ncbi:MAG: hypothetical protein HY722_06390 [Planctomycetes bacterium]|nr:hypothetical protein [Planctomycetota bacterium]
MIMFEIAERREPAAGRLVYDGTGFETEPRPAGCVVSVVVNYLEMMLDEEEKWVVFVTGYCPHQGWDRVPLRPPPARRASLRAVLDRPLVPGVSMGLDSSEERWPVLVDPAAGWVRLGKGDPDQDREGVQFAPGAIVVLEGGHLRALWLRPERLPALP